MDPGDKRSALVWDFMGAVEALEPEAFVMENVSALALSPKWRSVRERLSDAASGMGYALFSEVLDAADYGAPQRRERAFLIGFLGRAKSAGATLGAALSRRRRPRQTVRELLLRLPPAGSEGNPLTCKARIVAASRPELRRTPYSGMLFNGRGRPLDLSGQSHTLPACMGGNMTPIVDGRLLRDPGAEDWIAGFHACLLAGGDPKSAAIPPCVRRITTAEAAAIQTFPAEYSFAGSVSSVYRQIGNAVPRSLASAVAGAVMETLGKTRGA
jgi:DNA (cytosine-5)-methyltransferase 1